MKKRSRVSGMVKAGCLLAVAVAVFEAAATSGPDEVAITLERSACFGSCPVYKVTIHGDGHVQFTTNTSPVDEVDGVHRQFSPSGGVLLPGAHEDRVRPEAVKALVAQFEAADFWHLKDEYRAQVTDVPTQVITLVVGGRKKAVVDYMGTKAGMPQEVKDLEVAIDRAAGTDRWVSGAPGLVSWLEQTGFDFRSAHATELAVSGEVGEADEVTILSLIDHGAPLDQSVAPSRRFPGKVNIAGMTLLEGSIWRGHARVFERLVTYGWLDRLGKAKAAEVFAEHAAGCSPAMVDAAANAGVDIDLAVFHRDDADEESQGKTALAELGASYACYRDEAARVLTAKSLLARGADPNHRDRLGRTPLYGVENLELLNVLLAHGADPSVKSKDGRSMLFGSWTDAIVLRLLEAGASPVGRYDYDGKTLAQQAKARDMPLVAQWLVAHPEAFRR
ncbi:DUF6438 domain-containing protein [Dyella koreensis]|uniref:DUF6438 domain-containing protein n=1 Tax=Dyella koreensis TaxID=311235 RepID=A0ABW8K3F4_9GAMM